MQRLQPILVLFLTVFVVGCGGSGTTDRFKQIAEARAARNRAARADDEKDEQAEQQPNNAPAAKVAAAKDEPAETESANQGDAPEKTEPKQDENTAKTDQPPNDGDDDNDDDDDQPTRPRPVVARTSGLPRRDVLMAISRGGATLAHVNNSNTIGIYEVESKKLVRRIYNPELEPFAVAISPSQKKLAVGGIDGSFKTFSLDSIDGLDRFEQKRLRRQDLQSPRRGHDHPITAIAIDDDSEIVVTGDANGEIKFWTASDSEPIELIGPGSRWRSILSYQDNNIVFAANDNSISYWSLDSKVRQSLVFDNTQFDASPSVMVPGPKGKGLAVGDANGGIHLWTLSDGDLQLSNLQAHQAAVAGIGFSPDGRSMTTVSRTGQINTWALPLRGTQRIRLFEKTQQLMVDPGSDLFAVPSSNKNFDVYSAKEGAGKRRHVVPRGDLSTGVFQSGGDLVALASTSGDIFFQGENGRTIASLTPPSSVVEFVTLPNQRDRFGFRCQDGAIGVARFPQPTPRPMVSLKGSVWASSTDGRQTVIVEAGQLRVIETDSGRVEKQVDASEVVADADSTITAVYLDKNLLLIGTSSGQVYAGSLLDSDAAFVLQAAQTHADKIVALGTTLKDEIWSCDASGKNVQSAPALGGGDAADADEASSFEVKLEGVNPIIARGGLWRTAGDTVYRHDSTGEILNQWQLADQEIIQLCVRASGERAVAVTSGGQFWVVETPKNESEAIEPQKVDLPVNEAVSSMVWSHDGTRVAVVAGRRLIGVNTESLKVDSVQSQDLTDWQAATWSPAGVLMRKPTGQWFQIQPAGFSWTDPAAASAGLCVVDNGDQLLTTTLQGQCTRRTEATGETLPGAAINAQVEDLVSLAGTGAVVLLDDRSILHLIDDQNAVASLPITVPSGIDQIATDSSGGKLLVVTRDGRILSWSVDDFEKPANTIPCDLSCAALASAPNGQLLVAGRDSNFVSVVATDSGFQPVRPSSTLVTDACPTPDGRYVALASGTDTIDLVALDDAADRGSRPLKAEGMFLEKLAVSPDGASIAALGDSAGAESVSRLVLIDTVSGDVRSSVDLRTRGREVHFGPDGSQIAVQLDDETVSIHAAGSGDPIETIGPIPGLETIGISDDSSRLMVGRSGGVVSLVPLTSRGKADAGQTAVISIDFHRGSKYFLSASLDGTVQLWSRASLDAPQALFKGLEVPIAQSAVSDDGKFVAAVYEDEENSVFVWDIDSASSNQTLIDAKVVLKADIRNTAAAFTSDSRYVLLGGADGAIRAWSLSEAREVARFTGHEGPIAQIAAKNLPGQFVSSGRDKSIRSWRFPATLPGPGARIPDGALSDSTAVQEIAALRSDAELFKEDPTDAARQALISGAKTTEVVDLLEVSDEVKQNVKSSIERVASLENGRRISAKELSRERRNLARSQERLQPSSSGGSLSTFVDGFSNLSFVGKTNFKFDPEEAFRPVRLLIDDRFLYAARPSAGKRQQRGRGDDDDDDDRPEEEEDQGDNGALLSWDFKFSRLQAHAWSIEDIRLSQLVTLPNSAGVFTVPQIVLFNQDGSSRPFGFAAAWAKSLQLPPSAQYLAVASAGAARVESDILSLFNVADFSQDNIVPTSRYRSFEGIVTAMAFANNSPYVAFCVRERAIHRLFLADIETLTVQELERFSHREPWTSGTANLTSVQSRRIPSINALAFSPDDQNLIAHSNLSAVGRRGGGASYKLTRWNLRWDGQQVVDVRKHPRELTGEQPFIRETQNQPFRFITRTRGATAESGGPTREEKGTTTGTAKLLLQNARGFEIINYSAWRPERLIPFLRTQRSVPVFSLSEDNSWLVMANDTGSAFVYDVVNGRQYQVTSSEVVESKIADANLRTPALDQRPAHTGPVVGVGLGPPDPGQDYPAFVATCGEENKIKVWEMFPILDPTSGLRARDWGTEIKTIRRQSNNRR